MYFVHDNRAPPTAAESEGVRRALREFETAPEARFDANSRILPTVLNTLVSQGRKFYLVHLPDGGGWVLRRHRPTGEFHGKPNTDPDTRPAPEPGELPAPAEGERGAPHDADPPAAREYAEERLGHEHLGGDGLD